MEGVTSTEVLDWWSRGMPLVHTRAAGGVKHVTLYQGRERTGTVEGRAMM